MKLLQKTVSDEIAIIMGNWLIMGTTPGVGEATPSFSSSIPELKSWSDSESDLESDPGDSASVNAKADAPVQQKGVTVL